MTTDNIPKEKGVSDISDPAELWAEIIRLRTAVKGPDQYATWKDAAIDEKIKRIQLERENAELRKAGQALVDRWDTPLWKEAQPTADYINKLRLALAIPIPEFLRNQENLEAERASLEPKWQPIETAPKGVKILGAYRNSLGKWRRVMMRYYGPDELETISSEEDYAPEGWYEECESQEDIRTTDEPPILWQHLPLLPETPRQLTETKEVCSGCGETQPCKRDCPAGSIRGTRDEHDPVVLNLRHAYEELFINCKPCEQREAEAIMSAIRVLQGNSPLETKGVDMSDEPFGDPHPLDVAKYDEQHSRNHYARNRFDRDLCDTCGKRYEEHERNETGNWCPQNTGEGHS